MNGTAARPPLRKYSVLAIDDEAPFLDSVTLQLKAAGIHKVVALGDGGEAGRYLRENDFSAVLLDLTMPGKPGEEVLEEIVHAHPDVPVIILTGIGEVETAVRLIKAGAFDYLLKPIEGDRLISSVRRAMEMRELRRENESLRNSFLTHELKSPDAFRELTTVDWKMCSIFQYIESIAATEYPILILGETGVGKELVARAIHAASGRQGRFVAVNLAGVDDNAFADTLFGHRKGAFTGADEARNGLVETAAGGTLFLDEIGDLAEASQVKLLRLLQEREYYPLGSDMVKKSNANMILATHRDLARLADEGRFRKDLLYRLRIHQVKIPPLRERMGDIPALADHFLEKAAAALGKRKPAAPKELHALLATHHFPGNVRELEGMMYDAVSRHQGKTLSLASFKEAMDSGAGKDAAGPAPIPLGHAEGLALLYGLNHGRFPKLKEVEHLLIGEALRRADGNQTLAARMLGLSRCTLNKRL